MEEQSFPSDEVCKACTVGSCCYEGTELTKEEVKRIEAYRPKVAKPWFRKVKPNEEPDGLHEYSTVIRNGTCVFQNKLNQCLVYEVRPSFCREFPVENGQAAPYLKSLCVLYNESWAEGSDMKKKLIKREKGRFL